MCVAGSPRRRGGTTFDLSIQPGRAMSTYESNSSTTPSTMPARGDRFLRILLRLVSGLGGVLILAGGAMLTVGTALAAPGGIFVAGGLARRKRQQLSPIASWVGASAASSIALVIMLGIGAMLLPPGTLGQIESATAAARAEPPPRPPEWIARVFPQTTQRPDPVTERVINSRAFTLYFGLLGVAMACLILGTIAGTVGWIGVQLLVFAFRGRRAAS
jgi:hypothetical protein